MQIQIESRQQNTIIAYDETSLKINDTLYRDSMIISNGSIIPHWPVHRLQDLKKADLSEIIALEPQIILFGHQTLGSQLPISIQEWLSQQRIGFESMLLGAACRTFNVLLGEDRRVVFAVIFA